MVGVGASVSYRSALISAAISAVAMAQRAVVGGKFNIMLFLPKRSATAMNCCAANTWVLEHF